LAAAGADVEDAAAIRVVEKREIDRGDVLDRDEVAALLARAVAVAAVEQAHLAVALELVEVVERHGGHAPLVRLALAADVELPQAHDRRRRPRQQPAQARVAEERRAAVNAARRPVRALL